METVTNIQDLPELTTDMIHVWHVFVPDVKASLGMLMQVLSAEERAKADRFRLRTRKPTRTMPDPSLLVLVAPSTLVGACFSERGSQHARLFDLLLH